MFMTTVIKCLSLNFEIKLNCHVVGFDTGCHEAIITVMNIFRDLNYSVTNLFCH